MHKMKNNQKMVRFVAIVMLVALVLTSLVAFL